MASSARPQAHLVGGWTRSESGSAPVASAAVDIYTRKGDDGTTGLLYGGRVGKGSPQTEAYGEVDEVQAVIGVARAHSEPGGELDAILVGIQRDLWVLMADLATGRANRAKLSAGTTLVTPDMVTHLEGLIDEVGTRFEAPDRVRHPRRDRARRPPRRGPHRGAPGRAPGGGPPRSQRRRPGLPQPPVRPVLDARPLAGGHLADRARLVTPAHPVAAPRPRSRPAPT